LGFVRLVTNPAFSPDALSPAEAITLLAKNLVHPGHEFWSDSLQLPLALRGLEPQLQGYRQLTDAYLLALAHQHKGVLATFDRSLRALGAEKFESTLEVVATR
jgi:hypothetical protein